MSQTTSTITPLEYAPAVLKQHIPLVDLVALLVLAMIWGASFLFMRVATPEFGAIALIEVRVFIASLVLIPLAASRGVLADIRRHPGPMLLLGAVNSAIPFSLLAYATLSLTAGFASIINATAPIFAAIISFVWLGQRLSRLRTIGLFIAIAGVVLLVWGKASIKPGGSGHAIYGGLLAATCYGISANYTKRRLPHVSALAISTGSQVGAVIFLLPLAVLFHPSRMPSLRAWLSVTALATLCTAVAYLLYFRLIHRLGPTRTITVTFLIPLFGMLWGAIFLRESITLQTVAGATVILAGTMLSTGLLDRRT